MKFTVKGFFNKCDQIRNFLRIWSHLLKKSIMNNFIFCAVNHKNFIQFAEAAVGRCSAIEMF